MPPALQSSQRRRRAGIRYYRSGPASYAPLFTVAAATVALLAAANLALLRGLIVPDAAPAATPGRHRQGRSAPLVRRAAKAPKRKRAAVHALPGVVTGPINPKVPGLTTFRGNLTRSYYGAGPVPRRAPRILWRYPRTGRMCSLSTDETGRHTWCGIGWTGQPNVIPHAARARRAPLRRLRPRLPLPRTRRRARCCGRTLLTGDLAKGSATSDPDGYPLYYAGSRDNKLRVVALDRARPTVLWQVDADTSVPKVVWNNDWDGAPLVVGDYLLEGGENSLVLRDQAQPRLRPHGQGASASEDRAAGAELGRTAAGLDARSGVLDRELRRVLPWDRVLRELGRARAGLGHAPTC